MNQFHRYFSLVAIAMLLFSAVSVTGYSQSPRHRRDDIRSARESLRERRAGGRVPAPSPAPVPQGEFAAIEQMIHQEINKYRASRGLPALTLMPELSAQARAHSQAMASGAVAFGHGGFEERVKLLRQQIGGTSSAENVAFNRGYISVASVAVNGWLDSPGHRKNIEGNFTFTGIGVAVNDRQEYYITQLFWQ